MYILNIKLSLAVSQLLNLNFVIKLKLNFQKRNNFLIDLYVVPDKYEKLCH